MSNQELTPAQEAQIPGYIARYTAMALRCTRENTTDRPKACLAVENLFRATEKYDHVTTYIHVEHVTNVLFKNLKTGKTIEIPKGYTPPKEVFYCISGSWPTMLSLARHWTGEDDVSSALCLAQHAVHAPAYAEFVVKVLGIRECEANAKALYDFSADCGITLQYENCTLIGDSPVAHQILDDGKIQPIFTEKRALELGLELPDFDKETYLDKAEEAAKSYVTPVTISIQGASAMSNMATFVPNPTDFVTRLFNV